MRETRPEVIAHHVLMATNNSGLTFRAYATAVRDAYLLRTPELRRSVCFHSTRDPYGDERANAQIVRRALDDLDRLPCALEEALVLSLPDPFQRECRRELAARYGELAAAIPSNEQGAQVMQAATLMKETGEALADLAQCMDGDTVLPGHRERRERAAQNLDDVIAAAVSLKARLAGDLVAPGMIRVVKP